MTEALRVALVTTHLPLKSNKRCDYPELLREIITILHHDLRQIWYPITCTVAGLRLNPHAGEAAIWYGRD